MSWLVEFVAQFVADVIGALVELMINAIKALFRKTGEVIGAVFRGIVRRGRKPGRHAVRSEWSTRR
jgi:hypothetical protein